MDIDPVAVKVDGVLYVYIDEECIVRVTDLLMFAKENEIEFYCWRQSWGEERFATLMEQ